MENRQMLPRVGLAALALALAVPAFAFAQTEGSPAEKAPGEQAQPARPLAPLLRFRRGFGPHAAGLLKATQEVTGLSAQEIREQLAAGKTLAQIAAAEGKTAQDVVAAARADVEERLDEAVKGGWITQDQADARLKALDERAQDMATQLEAAPGQLRGLRPGLGKHGDCPQMQDKPEGGTANPGLWHRGSPAGPGNA
jgi:hypothetical protein